MCARAAQSTAAERAVVTEDDIRAAGRRAASSGDDDYATTCAVALISDPGSESWKDAAARIVATRDAAYFGWPISTRDAWIVFGEQAS